MTHSSEETSTPPPVTLTRAGGPDAGATVATAIQRVDGQGQGIGETPQFTSASATPSSDPVSHRQQAVAAQSQPDGLRDAIDRGASGRQSDREAARTSIDRAHDLSAQVFRLRGELNAARLSAAECAGRMVGLEREIREISEQRLPPVPHADIAPGQADAALTDAPRRTSASALPGINGQLMLEHALQAHAQEKARFKEELGEARKFGSEAVQTLDALLHSRSWMLMRPLRVLLERLRGRRWVEPQMLAIPWSQQPELSAPSHGAADPWGCIAGLKFPSFPVPRVSIIVPAYGNLTVTARCLRSIQKHISLVPHEVILVEDRSGDSEIGVLAEVPGLVYHENEQNLGFLHSCNAATGLVRGEFVCFLNNDTEVTAGWLDELLQVYERFPDCGMVGAKLTFPDGTLQEAGGIIWADGSGWNVGRHGDPAAPEFNYVREVDYCSGAALMLRTDLFNQLGRFDDRYAPAYYEDADLAFRIREQGLKVYYCPLAEVKHIEGASHGTDAGSGIKAFQTRNRKIFRERWRHVLDRRHYRNGECVFRARDHARHKPVVLVTDHSLPQPDRDAGSRAMLQTMVRLTRMGMMVKFWPNDHLYNDRFRHLLEDAGVEVVIGERWDGSFEEFVREVGQEIDFAVLSRPNFAEPFLTHLRQYSRARIALFGHDIHYRRMLAQAEVTGDEAARAGALEMQQLEQSLWRQVDSIIYPSQEEADVVADHVGMDKVHVVPLYCFEEHELTLTQHEPGTVKLLFVAGFGHPPNEDAAEWLAAEILPRILRKLPSAVLHLVGSNPTARVRALAGPTVKLSPNVSSEELEGHYRNATVAIAPLRFGGGVKLKVVEAMARGVPMVTTSVGAQGLPGVADCIGVADDAQELAHIVTGLVNDRARALVVAKAAHAYLRDHYSEQNMERALWRALAGAEQLPA